VNALARVLAEHAQPEVDVLGHRILTVLAGVGDIEVDGLLGALSSAMALRKLIVESSSPSA
jgi:hypothetical protein